MNQNKITRNTAPPAEYLMMDEADSDSKISFDQHRIFYRRSNNASPASSAGSSYCSGNRHSPDMNKRHSVTDAQQQLNNRDTATRNNSSDFRTSGDNRKRNFLEQAGAQYAAERSAEDQRLSEFPADNFNSQKRNRITDHKIQNGARCAAERSTEAQRLSEFSADAISMQVHDRITDREIHIGARCAAERSTEAETPGPIPSARTVTLTTTGGPTIINSLLG